jgi:hypothetical protein
MTPLSCDRARFRLSNHILAPLFLLLLIAPDHINSQTSNSAGLIVVRLEKRVGNTSKAVPQNTVFRSGDVLRFRLTSKFTGYLYVVDKGTTGTTNTLFPVTTGPGANNSVAANQSTLVPATGDGWFEVSGPPGFDVLYIMVSATPMSLPPPEQQPGNKTAQTPASEAPLPADLLPRCDDAIFKARGDCIDSAAGVAPLPPDAAVPRELVPLAKTASRDIILTDDGDGTAVQPGPSAKLPLIYTFRLAHLN